MQMLDIMELFRFDIYFLDFRSAKLLNKVINYAQIN